MSRVSLIDVLVISLYCHLSCAACFWPQKYQVDARAVSNENLDQIARSNLRRRPRFDQMSILNFLEIGVFPQHTLQFGYIYLIRHSRANIKERSTHFLFKTLLCLHNRTIKASGVNGRTLKSEFCDKWITQFVLCSKR